MAKPSTVFVCSACGTESAKWHGQCPGCGAWNTLAEEATAPAAKAKRAAGRAVKPVRLVDVKAERHARLRTGIGELDRILGGGLVPGSLVLIGGSPGIGKSTLTGMALGNLVAAGRRTLYVSAMWKRSRPPGYRCGRTASPPASMSRAARATTGIPCVSAVAAASRRRSPARPSSPSRPRVRSIRA